MDKTSTLLVLCELEHRVHTHIRHEITYSADRWGGEPDRDVDIVLRSIENEISRVWELVANANESQLKLTDYLTDSSWQPEPPSQALEDE